MNPILRPWGWIWDVIERRAARKREARLKAVRASIWQNTPPPSIVRENLLLDLARLDIGQDHESGIETIDRHHKIFVLMYNSLVGDVGKMKSKVEAPLAIFKKLKTLVASLIEHFGEEEMAMKSRSYPGLRLHKVQHDYFLKTVLALMDDVKLGEFGIDEFVFYIGAWMSAHILISDIYFAEYAKGGMTEPVPAAGPQRSAADPSGPGH